jgi:hypothetical protein
MICLFKSFLFFDDNNCGYTMVLPTFQIHSLLNPRGIFGNWTQRRSVLPSWKTDLCVHILCAYTVYTWHIIHIYLWCIYTHCVLYIYVIYCLYIIWLYLFIYYMLYKWTLCIYIYIYTYVMHSIDLYNTAYIYILYNIYLCIHLYTKMTNMYTYTNKDVL